MDDAKGRRALRAAAKILIDHNCHLIFDEMSEDDLVVPLLKAMRAAHLEYGDDYAVPQIVGTALHEISLGLDDAQEIAEGIPPDSVRSTIFTSGMYLGFILGAAGGVASTPDSMFQYLDGTYGPEGAPSDADYQRMTATRNQEFSLLTYAASEQGLVSVSTAAIEIAIAHREGATDEEIELRFLADIPMRERMAQRHAEAEITERKDG